MRIYGYSRVSTKDQNLDRQIVELKKYVEERFIFQDKQSGKDFDRPQYQLMRKVAQKGDIIYVKSLDRLGRNKSQIKEELEYYSNEGVRVKVLDIPTTMMDVQEGQEWLINMINNLLIEVLSTMAEQERINIRQRQSEGIAIAKEKGKYKGRKKIEIDDNFKKVYDKWKAEEITAYKAMELTGLKRNTFYRRVTEYEIIEEDLKNTFRDLINKVEKEFKNGNYDEKLYDELEKYVFKVQKERGKQSKKVTDQLKNPNVLGGELIRDSEIGKLENKAIKLMDMFGKRYEH